MSSEYQATGSQGRMRTSDTEREQVAVILRAAMSEGRLTLEEGEERLGAVYAAKFRDELAPLTADLPGGGREALHRTPEARTRHRREIRRMAWFVAFAAVVLTGLWALSGAHFFWPAIPLFFMVAGVVRRSHEGPAFGRHPHRGQVGPCRTSDC